MTRSDIYSSLAKDIAKRLKDSGIITDNDEYDDIIDNATRKNLTGIFDNIANKDIFASVADGISTWDGTEDNVETGSNFYIIDVKQPNEQYFKNIGVYEDNAKFVCVAADKLNEFQNNLGAEGMRLVERIWTAIHTDTTKKNDFWNLFSNGGANKYIVITNATPTNEEEEWRLYCFGYLLYCNSNKIILHPDLAFDEETEFSSSISLNIGVKYEQYFEVYDLINESHSCNDILSRYLNMYHIIENMCYRRHLAKISRGDLKRNAYVRKALRHFGRGSKAESDEIPEGIVKLFPRIDTLITGIDFTVDIRKFINEEYNIPLSTPPNPKQIAQVIYQLRNSIAHNKATELHFGYANHNEYSVVIPLIKRIIEKMEPAIINLIENNPTPGSDHPLEYKARNFEIY